MGTPPSINVPETNSLTSLMKCSSSCSTILRYQEQFDGSRPWESFIFSFENIAVACGWNGREKQFWLLAALRNRFGDRKSPASFVIHLETRRLRPKEASADYAADIRKLTTFSYPTADVAIIETIRMRHFLRALGDHNMTLTLRMHEPKSLQEAQEIAHAASIWERRPVAAGNPTPHNPDDGMTRRPSYKVL